MTETSLHSNQRPCMLEFLLITASATMWAPSQHSNTHPLEGSRFQLNLCIGDPIFFYCTFYKVMTHSVLASMLPRMYTFPKMKILSSFTHPQVVPNLYECLCSAEHTGRYSEECGKQSSSGAPLTSIVLFFPTMEVNGAPKQPGYKLSSKYLPLCLAEHRNSYRFGTTWGWVNDDKFFIFGWTIPLNM